MKKLSLEINNQYSTLKSPEAVTREILGLVNESGRFPIEGGELSIAFVDDAVISKIHADYMGDPSPTDVITFPADASMDSAGEIIVSVDHARQRALELEEPLSRELCLYLVHGWLHLAGYDDHTDEDRIVMKAAEKEALALLQANEKDMNYQLSTQE